MASRSESRLGRVLVTGLEGFTGRYVGEELRRAGYQVFGLQHSAPVTQAVPVDLLDADAVKHVVAAVRPHAVIHLAAIASVVHDDIEAIYRTNILGTRHLLSALAEASTTPATVVLASSANVYGNADGVASPLSERTALAPTNDYAVSKVAMEYMARTWSARLPLVFTRPFNYTGVGQSPQFLIPKIVDHFRRGQRLIELGNLDVWREFTDVRSMAWAYRRLIETRGAHDTYNLCSGRSHSLREVLAMMADIAGYSIEVQVNPAFVRGNELTRLEGDPSRLHACIGTPPPYTLPQTLSWMYHASPAL